MTDAIGVMASQKAAPAPGKQAYAHGVDIRVLGPVEVWIDGKAVGLGGPKQRALLALLVAAAPRVVSRDALIDGIWGEEPSAGARSTLQTYVSNLRQALGDVVVYERGGYRLAVEAEAIDAVRFTSVLEAAGTGVTTDAAGTAVRLRDVLGSWKGRPYADLVDVHGLDGEIRRLEGLRLEAVELRIDADLATGRHGVLVTELEALAEEHPIRERFRAQHMLALYRSGRQAEALRAYRRTETYLAEELGVDPSPELRDLELAILQQDASLLEGAGRVVTQRLAFLVTDIKGSTGLWDRHPQAMADALAAHDRVLRAAIEEAGGSVVKSTGDGVLAVFPDVVSAAEAAEAALRGLTTVDWGEVGELRVRVGIDVGEADSRGGDFYGPAVNRASRLGTIGHGGQVLVSSMAQEELAASARAGMQMRQLGEFRLRGIATPERIAQLVFVGLPADFPDPRVNAESSLDEPLGVVSLPGYEVRERLDEGAMAVVWRAYQPSVGREVAIKAIRPDLVSDPSFVRRFEAEARTISRLAHPHIVPLIDFWRDTDGAYLVLPLLPGGSVGEAAAQGPPDRVTVRRILGHVGAALDHAHSQGMVHGDLEPANVLLDGSGNAYLSDFGITARLLDPEVVMSVSGAPAYLAPELAITGPSPEADRFAFGALARELFGGTPDLEPVLARATATNPLDRYPTAAAFLSDLDEVLGEPAESERLVSARNPYKGLRAFDEADSADFYGRSELVATLVAAVERFRFVTVVGPSGSGKSSVVQAGLLPALARGAVTGSDVWSRTVLTPGLRPFEALAEALQRISTEPIDPTEFERSSLSATVDRLIGNDDQDGAQVLVVVDQFEELFTLTDPTRRQAFLDYLTNATEHADSRVRIMATLRADFYDRPLEHHGLGRLVRDGLVTVLPPTRDELLQMITAPAQAVGLRWEPGLPQRICQDVADQPGGLPLLQYALTELVERRTGDLLTSDDYTRIGGVAGALATRAEAVYTQLTPAQQRAARQVLLRLVTVDEDTDDTRRRVRRSELESLGIPRSDLDAVLDTFTTQRLLLADRDPLTRGPTVEVAHEALLREWPRLRGWVDDQREALILGRRFRAAIGDWETNDRHDDYLLTGHRLAPFTGWAETTSLTPDERAYHHASQRKDRAQRAAQRRRRQVLATILASATAIATVLAVIALWQRQAAQEQRQTAQEQQQLAERDARQAMVRQITGASELSLDGDPEGALLFALEAAQISRRAGDPPLPETVAALHQAVEGLRLELRLDAGAQAVAVSPDGRLVATDSWVPREEGSGNNVTLWDAASGEELATLPGLPAVSSLAFSPDGLFLAAALSSEPPAIGLWSPVVLSPGRGEAGYPPQLLTHLEPTTDLSSGDGVSIGSIAWSSDSDLLAAHLVNETTNTERVVMWDVASGTEMSSFEPDGAVGRTIRFLDPRTLLVPEHDAERVGFYDATTGVEVDALETPGFGPYWLAVDTDRSILVLGPHPDDVERREVQAWDLESRSRPIWTRPHDSVLDVHDIDLDAGLVAVGGSGNGDAHLLRIDDGSEVLRLVGRTSVFEAAAFYPTRRTLVSTGGGETLIKDVAQAVGAVEVGRLDHAPVFSPNGEEVAVVLLGDGTGEGTFTRLDPDTGAPLASLSGQNLEPAVAPVVSADWRVMASVDAAGQAWIRELDGWEIVSQLPPCTVPKAFSPDGTALVLDGIAAYELGLCSEDAVPAGTQRRSRVVDVESGAELLDLADRDVPSASGAAFNPAGAFEEGRYLAVIVGGDLEIYDMPSGDLISAVEFAQGLPLTVAFDPTGRYLAGGMQAGRAWVVDFERLVGGVPFGDSLVRNLRVDDGDIVQVALSSDGVLATVAAGSLRLWDIRSGHLLVEPDVEAPGPPFTAFSPGGVLVYADTSAETHALRSYVLDPERLIEVAEGLVTRGLRDDECLRYLGPDTCETISGGR